MNKTILILVIAAFCFSFTDGIDQFYVFLNQTQVGHWDENDMNNPVSTYIIKANLDKDTLKFVYWTDSGMQDNCKIEFKELNDSVIHFSPNAYWQNHYGTFVFPLARIKKEVESHKQMKVFIIPKYYGSDYNDTLTYQHHQLMGILKFE